MAPWQLIDRIGDLVPVLGTTQFGSEFFGLFSGALDVDECTVFAFSGERPPAPVVLEGRSDEMRQSACALASAYVSGAFARDPNVPRGAQGDTPIVRSVRASELQDASYRVQFYEEPRLSHELVLIGRYQETLYYSSFYRRDWQASFTDSEVDVAARLARVAIRMLHKHRDVTHATRAPAAPTLPDVALALPKGNREQLMSHLRDVLLSDPGGLSPREAQICAGIVLGYTTLGISLNFGISLNTVATHRKRAYRKLGISSQNELFSRYFKTVNDHIAAHAA